MGSSPTKHIRVPYKQPAQEIYDDDTEEQKEAGNDKSSQGIDIDAPAQIKQVVEKKTKKKKSKNIVFHAQLSQNYAEEFTKIYFHPLDWEWLEKNQYELQPERNCEVDGLKYFLYKVSIPVPYDISLTQDQPLRYSYSVVTSYEEEVEDDSEELNGSSDKDLVEIDSNLNLAIADQSSKIIQLSTSDQETCDNGSIRTTEFVGSETENIEHEKAQSTKGEQLPKEKHFKESFLTIEENVMRNVTVKPGEDHEVFDGVVPQNEWIKQKEKYVAKRLLLPAWDMIGYEKKKILPVKFIKQVKVIMDGTKYTEVEKEVIADFISEMPSLEEISTTRGRACSTSTAVVALCLNNRYNADHETCEDPELNKWLIIRDPSESQELQSYFPDMLTEVYLDPFLKYWWDGITTRHQYKETILATSLLHHLQRYCTKGEGTEARSTEYTERSESLLWWGVKHSTEIMSSLLQKGLTEDQRMLKFSNEEIVNIKKMATDNCLMWRTVAFSLSVKEMKCFDVETIPVYVWLAKWYQFLQMSHTTNDGLFVDRMTEALARNLEKSEARFALNGAELLIAVECVSQSIQNPQKDLAHLRSTLALIDIIIQEMHTQKVEAEIRHCTEVFEHQITALYEAKIGPKSAIEVEELEFFRSALNLKMKEEGTWMNTFTATLLKRLHGINEQSVLSAYCSKKVQQYLIDFPSSVSRALERRSRDICTTSPFIQVTEMLHKLTVESDFDRKQIRKLLFAAGFKGESSCDVRKVILSEEFLQMIDFSVVHLELKKIPEELIAYCGHLKDMLAELISGHVLFEDLEFAINHQEVLMPVMESLLKKKWVCPSNMSQWMDSEKVKGYQSQLKVLIALRQTEQQHYKQYKEKMDVLLSLLDLIPPVASLYQKMEPVRNLHQACKPLSAKEKYKQKQMPEIVAYKKVSQAMLQMITKLKSSDLYRMKTFQFIWIDVRQKLVDDNGELCQIGIDSVLKKVAEPAFNEWTELISRIQGKTITLDEVEVYLDHCFADETELRKIIQFAEVEGFEQQIHDYHSIRLFKRAADILMRIKFLYHVTAAFKELQCLQDWCSDKTMKLKDIKANIEELMPSPVFIDTFKTSEAVDCVDVLTKCHGLVNWVHNNIKSEKEVKTLIDLAMSGSGQEPIELQKAACLRSALGGYAPLIFRLGASDSFDRVINLCHLVVQNLNTDPLLPKKLDECQKLLEWIKHVRRSQGLVEVDAISQIRAINENSTMSIEFSEIKQEATEGIKVTLDASTTQYTTDKLLDLQNKVMLVSNDDKTTKAHVETYQQVLEIALHIIRVGKEMVNTGCQLLNMCNIKLLRKTGHPTETSVLLTGNTISHKGQEVDCLLAIVQVLKECQLQWARHIDDVRNHFYFVNRFTNDQMQLLRKNFAIWYNLPKEMVAKTLLLMQCINPDISSQLIEVHVSMVSHRGDRPISIKWPTAASKIGKFFNGLTASAEKLCNKFDCSEPDCFSLSHAAHLLEDIAKCTKTERKFDSTTSLSMGNPNLILCSPDEMITTVLSIYKYYSNDTLPTDEEILYCTSNTTFEEINILWKRAFSSKGSSKVFCLVNADQVRYEVADSSIKVFDACRKENKEYQVVVICNRMRQHISHFVTCLEPFKRQFLAEENGKLKEFLLDSFKMANDFADPNMSTVTLVTSQRAGMGKTLRVKSLAAQCDDHIKVPITDVCSTDEDVADDLMAKGLNMKGVKRILVHLDISHEVWQNIDMILFKLLFLGSLTTSEGYRWIKQPNHYYVIENVPLTKTIGHTDNDDQQNMLRSVRMLALLPELQCFSPVDVIQNETSEDTSGQLINAVEFGKEEFQIPIAYLKMMEENNVTFGQKNNRTSDIDDLKVVLRHCGISNCAWSEVQGFLSFLYTQLKDCEESSFCQIGSHNDTDLPGFGLFVVRFMLKMCQDFATRSLQIAEGESGERKTDRSDVGYELLEKMAVKRSWETSPHPYVFFNYDANTKTRTTFSFMGFYVNRKNRNLIDPKSKKILQKNIMSQELFDSLEANEVDLSENFDEKERDEKINTLCDIMGIESVTDPDESFVLTTDNVKKILAIYMRFRCNIPVIIMGETGCGKTRLIKFMCDLQKPQAVETLQNMIIVKVHGGTTRKHISEAVRNAMTLCQENKEKCPGIDTVLFFDEANTTPCIAFLKEIICDRSLCGTYINEPNLKIIAAVNPYRRHTKEMISKLEKAGLGYHVSADETIDCLGNIPMRELVYRVQPLPERMFHMVWDFGQLNETTEASYICQMVEKQLSSIADAGDIDWDPNMSAVIVEILQASQKFMRQQKDECRFVSLRDIERALAVFKWFHAKKDPLFQHMNQKAVEKKRRLFQQKRIIDTPVAFQEPNHWTRTLMLTLGVCYYASLSHRELYAEYIEKYFREPCSIARGSSLKREIEWCQDVFMDNITVSDTIAKNKALKENIFMMVVCIELRIPLFLVGRPGSSKSLAKAIVMDAMQGMISTSELFRDLKEVQMISYQCSPLSTAEGIVNTFNQCAKLQVENDLNKYTSVVVLDEVGLAEDSPQMPLKSLHALLEDGCEGTEKPELHQKVAFIGISNWALDPAKMNRGILVQRHVPDVQDLYKTARGICKNRHEIPSCLIKGLAESYDKLQHKCEAEKEFFGLRDYYGLIKMIYAFSQRSQQPLGWKEIKYAVLRNFGGLASVNPVEIFQYYAILPAEEYATDSGSREMDLILDGIRGENLGMQDSVSRYTLIMVESLGTLGILQSYFMEKNTIVLYGSSFPMDQDYLQICRNINKIKSYMETGKKVILLNLDNLYESLYDCLNQYYVELAGDKFVDLGLGNHRVKCRVDPEFRVSLLAEKSTVYEKYPVALINRLEKHFLSSTTILEVKHARIVRDLEVWIQEFITLENSTDTIQPENVFIGYHHDAIGSVVLRTVSSVGTDGNVKDDVMEEYDEEAIYRQITEKSKQKLLQCVTPDGILRLKLTKLNSSDKNLAQQYFLTQEHASLENFLKEKMYLINSKQQQLFFQVTTHSRLMSHVEIEELFGKLSGHGIALSRYKRGHHPPRVYGATASSRNVNMKNMPLNKYDTEQQFRKDLREFCSETVDTGVLVVQCEAGHLFQRLTACAQYIIWDEYQATQDANKSFIIALISQIPRYAVHRFTGFQGGKWDSWHIDELQQGSHCRVDIAKIQDKTICEVMQHALDGTAEAAFDLDVLVLETVHVACSRIVDLQDNMERKQTRLYCLLTLLESGNSSAFLQLFKARIVKLIEDKYALLRTTALNPDFEKDWLYKRVCKISHITKSASLRRAIWKYIQEEVSVVMTGLIAYIDRHNNLDIVRNTRKPLVQVWLDLLSDSSVTDCCYTEKFIMKPSNKELKRHPVVSELRNGGHFPLSFPFSFAVLKIVTKLIEIEERQTTDGATLLHKVKVKFNELPVGQYLQTGMNWSPDEMCRLYIHDFVRMVYLSSNTALHKQLEYEVIERELYHCLPSKDIISVQIVYREWRDRIENFKRLITYEDELIMQLQHIKRPAKAGIHFCLDLQALEIITKIYQPKITKLGFENIETWINRVSDVSPLITTALLAAERNNQKSQVKELHQMLEGLRRSWVNLAVVAVYAEKTAEMTAEKTAEKTAKHMTEVLSLWKNLQRSENVSVVAVLENLITSVTDTHKKIVKENLGWGFLNCVYCEHPVYEACFIEKCRHAYCHMCITTALLQLSHCCKKRCKEPLQASQIIRASSQKHTEAEEQIKKLKQSFQELFMRVLLLIYHDGRPMDTAVTDLLFRLITDQGIPVPILCDRSEDDQRFRLFLLQFIFLKCHRETTVKINDFLHSALSPASLVNRGMIHFLLACTLQCVEDKHNMDRELEKYRVNWTNELEDIGQRESTGDYVQICEDLSLIRHIIRGVSAAIHNSVKSSCEIGEDIYECLETMKLFNKRSKDLLRQYLVRHIVKTFGQESLDTAYKMDPWIFPEGEKSSAMVDVFGIYGVQYFQCKSLVLKLWRDLKDVKLRAELIDFIDDGNLNHVRGPALMLAILQVFCMSSRKTQFPQKVKDFAEVVLDKNLQISEKERKICAAFFDKKTISDANLMQLSRLQITELLEHFELILETTKSDFLGILKKMTKQPRVFENKHLPSMPEDELYKKVKAVKETELDELALYVCPNGHPYTIGECGMPYEEAKCPECSACIGGLDHELSEGGKAKKIMDRTKKGHCIAYPSTTTDDDVPRLVDPVSKFLLRLIVHMSLYIAATSQPQEVKPVIKRKYKGTIKSWIWEHMNQDLEKLASTLQKSRDDVVFICHMLLCSMSQHQETEETMTFNWNKRKDRNNWEKIFIGVYVSPLMQGMEMKLAEKMKEISETCKENDATSVINEVLPDGYKIQLKNVYSVPDVWKYKIPISVDHLRWNVACLPPEEDIDVLKLFLQQEKNLCLLQHLPEILELQWKLVKKFHLMININEANGMKIGNFLDGLEDAEKHEYEDLIASFTMVWNHFKESWKTFAFQLEPKKPPIVLPEEFHQVDITRAETPLSLLLPNVHGFGLCSLAVVHKLLDVHNTFVMKYQQTTGQMSEEVKLSTRTLTAGHTICYSVQQGLLPIIHANAKVPINYGCGSIIEYNYQGIQREINSRFLMRKPAIKLQITLIGYREHFNTDYIHLQKLDAFIKQESLPNKRQIKAECESLTLMEMNNALASLDIVILYLASIGLSQKHHGVTILKYLTDTLKMEGGLGIANALELKLIHSKYLWIEVSHERAKLLAVHGQEPFDDINMKFREPLPDATKQTLHRYLRETNNNVDHILDCLYEFILLHVAQERNENDIDYVDESGYPLGYSMDLFGDDPHYKGPKIDWVDFPADITMAYTVNTWHLALQSATL